MNYEDIARYSQIVSSIAFVAVMIWIWIKFIQPAVLAAQQNVNARLAQAERHRDEAKAALAALQADIDAAKRDAAGIKERTASQAQLEEKAAIAEAREAAERALQNAQGELQRARSAARVQFRDELLGSALDLARKQATARVDERVNEKLVANFLSTLEHGGPN